MVEGKEQPVFVLRRLVWGPKHSVAHMYVVIYPQRWCGAAIVSPLFHLLCYLCWHLQILDKVCSSAVKIPPFPAGPSHHPCWGWSETWVPVFPCSPLLHIQTLSQLPAYLNCGNSLPNNRHSSYNWAKFKSFNKSLNLYMSLSGQTLIIELFYFFPVMIHIF